MPAGLLLPAGSGQGPSGDRGGGGEQSPAECRAPGTHAGAHRRRGRSPAGWDGDGDAGYWIEENARDCREQGINATIAIGRLPHGQPLKPKRGPLPRDAGAKTPMTRKFESKRGAVIYGQSRAIVEPVNGQIKEARGLRRFLLRALKLESEWHLMAATHNLLKVFRFRRSQQQALVVVTG